jgi:hypothetical protein
VINVKLNIWSAGAAIPAPESITVKNGKSLRLSDWLALVKIRALGYIFLGHFRRSLLRRVI